MNSKPIPLLAGLLIMLLAAFSLAHAVENGDKLVSAARTGDVAQLKQLLQSGAKVDTQDSHGWTPLMAATEKGHGQTVRALLMWGANVNAQNDRGLSPLMLAAAEGHDDIVEMLLKAGADPRIKDKRGWTALKWAELSNHDKVVSLLKKTMPEKKASLNRSSPPVQRESISQTTAQFEKSQTTTKADESPKMTAVVTGVDQPDLCLRIRSGPGTTYSKIGCVELGEKLTITGEVSPNQNWARIVEPTNGWVYTPQIKSDYLLKRSARPVTSTGGQTSGVSRREEPDRPSLEDCYEACDREFHMTFGFGVRMEYRLCRQNCRDQHREVYWTR